MKNYFNEAERKDHLLILAIWNVIADKIEKSKCYSPEELKRLRTANTHLLKFSNLILERMEQKYGEQLVRELHTLKIVMTTKDSASVKATEDDKTVEMTVDNFYNMCDLALVACKGCKKDFKSCDRYEFLLKMDVPVIDEETKECPYRRSTNV